MHEENIGKIERFGLLPAENLILGEVLWIPARITHANRRFFVDVVGKIHIRKRSLGNVFADGSKQFCKAFWIETVVRVDDLKVKSPRAVKARIDARTVPAVFLMHDFDN